MANQRPKFVSIAAKISFVVVSVWVLGFAVFAGTMPEAPAVDTLPEADGIVVLTGGGGRLDAAVDLLQAQKGKRLLISGVHQTVPESDIANLVQAPQTLFSCCVDLDRNSSNTIDNALTTAEWVEKHQYNSIYLVTADYHMQRSQLLIEEALPDCEILPFPVHSNLSVQGLVMEYAKLSVTWLRSMTQL
ncbi:MAG: YdcF family protein [Kordiimonadaceae bacterium]|nr:YdcF family protein [Kordiimonadaceae bacterium]MBO6567866.1 YdcF family protein [Kordiimonadaceae bacterium]MBO6964404.1 YdcF family protein [Kordiimonadaceae bacterium]